MTMDSGPWSSEGFMKAEKGKEQVEQGAIYSSFTELLLGQYNKILLLSAVKLTHFQPPHDHFRTSK